MRIIAIIQARMESTRLPGKVLMDLCGKSVLEHIVTRARKSKYINEVVVATSTNDADDAIETLMMNMIFGGRIATFKPKMYLDRSKITFIRPFTYARESQINKSAKKLDIPLVISTCPNDKHTERENMKTMLKELYHKYPMAKDNFLLMLHNLEKLDLWEKNKEEN